MMSFPNKKNLNLRGTKKHGNTQQYESTKRIAREVVLHGGNLKRREEIGNSEGHVRPLSLVSSAHLILLYAY